MKPKIVLIRVVLPAPLGPRRPVHPASMSQEKLFKATKEPYRTVKLRIETNGTVDTMLLVCKAESLGFNKELLIPKDLLPSC